MKDSRDIYASSRNICEYVSYKLTKMIHHINATNGAAPALGYILRHDLLAIEDGIRRMAERGDEGDARFLGRSYGNMKKAAGFACEKLGDRRLQERLLLLIIIAWFAQSWPLLAVAQKKLVFKFAF